MARIRSIKPEVPHSESLGRVSRDARLLFILLWTICDDAGRCRGNSRMLASLLFPYDDDAPKLIEGWQQELEREGCIRRYTVEGNAYIEVCNWLKHQKIDKPSASKIPPFVESSRILANPRESAGILANDSGGIVEGSSEERKGREGKGEDLLSSANADESKPAVLPCPHLEIIRLYHELLPMGRQVNAKLWNGTRAKHLQARWKESVQFWTADVNGLSWWRQFFEHCAASRFLTGKVPSRQPGEAPFEVSLDFLVEQRNFVKCMEGKFNRESR